MARTFHVGYLSPRSLDDVARLVVTTSTKDQTLTKIQPGTIRDRSSDSSSGLDDISPADGTFDHGSDSKHPKRLAPSHLERCSLLAHRS
jgi:hypothetical protein